MFSRKCDLLHKINDFDKIATPITVWDKSTLLLLYYRKDHRESNWRTIESGAATKASTIN